MTEDEEFEALEQRLNMKEQEYEQINHPNGVTTWKTKPKEQPEALRLAFLLEVSSEHPTLINVDKRCAAELRRLHALNTELLEALTWIANVNAMDHEYQAKARAAIAKAQGASNE